MTDRINGFWVALEENIRIDDAEPLMNAVRYMRGVLDVKPNVADYTAYTAEARVRDELHRKLLDVIYPRPPTKG